MKAGAAEKCFLIIGATRSPGEGCAKLLFADQGVVQSARVTMVIFCFRLKLHI